jgi:hypothetical protein
MRTADPSGTRCESTKSLNLGNTHCRRSLLATTICD